MYYVSTKGGGRGSAKCLRLLTGGGGGLRGLAYIIIVWKKLLNNLHTLQNLNKNSFQEGDYANYSDIFSKL